MRTALVSALLVAVVGLAGCTTTDPTVAPPSSPAAAPEGGYTSPEAGEGAEPGGGAVLTVDTDGATETIACEGRDVVVRGKRIVLRLTGGCGTLTVDGTGNTVTVESVSAIAVSGSDNTVEYRDGDPTIEGAGGTNTVTRR